MSLPEYISNIHTFLVEKGFPSSIDAAIILGSGLGSFEEHIQNKRTIPYSEIPGFPQSTVTGHSGSLLFGEVSGKNVLAFSGRFHFYEGHSFDKTIIPVQLSKSFNIEKLIISNAAGGINLTFQVGDLMIIRNIMYPHIDLPFKKENTKLVELEQSAVKVQEIANQLQVPTKTGTYLYVTGPNYETKAEIHAFRYLGGDAVGMSTAPEILEAFRLGIKVGAISLITNAAAGITDQKLDHSEVKDAADAKKDVFAKLVKGLIQEF